MKRTLLTAIGGLLLLITLSACAQTDQNGRLSSNKPLTHDWGEINIMGGLVSHEFELTNTSENEIVLTGAPTSCMCTTAQFEFEGENYSPKFGLHSNPTNWSYPVAPGEEFELFVTFDPLAHGPQATGPISRTVSVLSQNSAPTEIKVFGNVLSEKEYKEKYGTTGFQMGDFVFQEKEYDYGIIKQSGPIAKHEFKFTYTGDDPITITGVPTSCSCTSATIENKQLKKGDTGSIMVEFDPNLHQEPEGKFFKTITVLTEPEQPEDVEIKIWAEIDLDLGPEAYKLKEEHID